MVKEMLKRIDTENAFWYHRSDYNVSSCYTVHRVAYIHFEDIFEAWYSDVDDYDAWYILQET